MIISVGNSVKQTDTKGFVSKGVIVELEIHDGKILARVQWDGSGFKTWEPASTLEIVGEENG